MFGRVKLELLFFHATNYTVYSSIFNRNIYASIQNVEEYEQLPVRHNEDAINRYVLFHLVVAM